MLQLVLPVLQGHLSQVMFCRRWVLRVPGQKERFVFRFQTLPPKKSLIIRSSTFGCLSRGFVVSSAPFLSLPFVFNTWLNCLMLALELRVNQLKSHAIIYLTINTGQPTLLQTLRLTLPKSNPCSPLNPRDPMMIRLVFCLSVSFTMASAGVP